MTEEEIEKAASNKEVVTLALHYIDFIHSLEYLKFALDNGEDPRKVCLKALECVTMLVNLDAHAFKDGLAQPFGLMAAALNDLITGNNPALCAKPTKGKRGRKSGDAFNFVKAVAAAALHLRFHHGAKLDESAREIARELKKIGVEYRGLRTEIDANTIIGWRDEMGLSGRNPQLAKETYQQIIKLSEYYLGPEPTFARVERHVTLFIKALVHSGAIYPPPKKIG